MIEIYWRESAIGCLPLSRGQGSGEVRILQHFGKDVSKTSQLSPVIQGRVPPLFTPCQGRVFGGTEGQGRVFDGARRGSKGQGVMRFLQLLWLQFTWPDVCSASMLSWTHTGYRNTEIQTYRGMSVSPKLVTVVESDSSCLSLWFLFKWGSVLSRLDTGQTHHAFLLNVYYISTQNRDGWSSWASYERRRVGCWEYN